MAIGSFITYAGKPGHEIVQIHDATFDDALVYERTCIDGYESDGASFRAKWYDSSNFSDESPLVPEGLHDLLKALLMLE